jgi:hypothetical protein
VDAATISAATFTVNGVTGTVTYDAASRTATFMPAAPLAFGTTYTATMTTQVKDLAGNAMAANQVWTFTTRAAPAWGTASQIGHSDADMAQIAIDPYGNALAVWAQHDGTSYNIWANRYTASAGWGTAGLIETGTGDANSPQIAIDANGNAIAVWHQSDGTRDNIWANRYTAGAGWGTASLIETGDGTTTYPQIAIDANGNAIAVWRQYDGTRYNIHANRYDAAGAGWGTASLIESGNGNVLEPQIAVDPNGNAMAVWPQVDGTSYSIWANRYIAGAGWGTASLIDTAAGAAHEPQIAIDPNGNVIAVWIQQDGTAFSIHANRYDAAGAGWGTASLIETATGEAYDPQIAIDRSGNAIAVWRQFDGTRFNIHANRYAAGTGWVEASLIETGDGGAYGPQIAFDPNGNAIAVWYQFDSAYASIYANRYTAAAGWGTASSIETSAGDVGNPQIAFNPNGKAIAVWPQSDDNGYYNVWANRFE